MKERLLNSLINQTTTIIEYKDTLIDSLSSTTRTTTEQVNKLMDSTASQITTSEPNGQLLGWIVNLAIAVIIPCLIVLVLRIIKKIKIIRFGRTKWGNDDYTSIARNTKLQNDFFDSIGNNGAFIIPFHANLRSELTDLNFNEVNFDDIKSYYIDHLRFFFDSYNEEIKYNDTCYSFDEFINKISEDTSIQFIKDIRDGKVRFNKYLFGVKSVTLKDSKCCIGLYNSDYFTFKCMTNIFNILKNNKLINHSLILMDDKITHENIIENKVPFLNSIGVGGFIIINRGHGDELVWGFRGVNCQSGGYWHFSYDETFTQDDHDTDSSPSLTKCLKRAIVEEMGILYEDQKKCIPSSQVYLIDAGIIHTDGGDNRFEFEVCSCVRVCLSQDYTFDDFIQGYRFAKDAEIETKCLDFIPISELDTFLKDNKTSPEAQALSRQLKYLLYNKLIGSDKHGYKEISNSKKVG